MGEVCIKNSSLGKSLEFLLDSEGKGKLIGVFHHAWYIDFDGVVAVLCNNSYGYISFCAGFRDFEDFFVYNKKSENTEVRYKEGSLEIPAAGIKIELQRGGDPGFDVYKSAADVLVLKEALKQNGRGYLKEIFFGENPENPFFKRSEALIGEFTDAYKNMDENAEKRLLGSMLGLGSGLTPAMDDWLCGFFYCMLRFDPQKAHARSISGYVQSIGPEYTNRISFAYLGAVLSEDRFELLDNALYLGDTDRLLTIGSSSGSDMLCGIISAIEIINRKQRIN